MANDPFFVVGSDRSGTTMFRLMLNQHSRLSVARESWFLIDLMDSFPPTNTLTEEQALAAVSIIANHKRWPDWEIDAEDLKATITKLDQPSIASIFDAVVRMSSGEGKRWGDKTPGYVTQILRIHQIYPKAKFIHMIRDARDVCLSLYRTAWKGKETRQIAQYWNDCVSDGVRQGAQLPAGAYMEVHYEDLVLDTRGSLQKVCDFLDEPFEENMLEFHLDVSDKIAPWEQEFHTKTMRAPKSSDVGRWRKEMTTLQLATLEYVAGKTMEQTGQNRFYNGAGSLIPLGVGLGYWAADVSLPIRRALGIHFPHLRRKL